MAQEPSPHFDKHRRDLAYFWSLFAACALSYIIVRWGDRVEILTLIIGLIGGTIIGGIFSVFFVLNNKSNTVTQAAETITNQPSPTETTAADQPAA